MLREKRYVYFISYVVVCVLYCLGIHLRNNVHFNIVKVRTYPQFIVTIISYFYVMAHGVYVSLQTRILGRGAGGKPSLRDLYQSLIRIPNNDLLDVKKKLLHIMQKLNIKMFQNIDFNIFLRFVTWDVLYYVFLQNWAS